MEVFETPQVAGASGSAQAESAGYSEETILVPDSQYLGDTSL